MENWNKKKELENSHSTRELTGVWTIDLMNLLFELKKKFCNWGKKLELPLLTIIVSLCKALCAAYCSDSMGYSLLRNTKIARFHFCISL